MKHKEQRVLVLFDVQNLYYSAKQLYHAKVDFSNILAKAISSRKLIRAIAYVIKTDIKEEVNFHDALNKIGIEVKAKDLQIFLGGAKKGDWDIGIAMDAVRLSPKVDVVVLVSGDGDFKDLLQYLQSHGCRAEVIAFGRTASKHIKDVADDYVDLEKDPQRYLINYRRGFSGQKKGFSNISNNISNIQSQPLQNYDTNNQHQNTNNSNKYNNNTYNIHSASLQQGPIINSSASTQQSILPPISGPAKFGLPAMKAIREAEQRQIAAQEKKDEMKEERRDVQREGRKEFVREERKEEKLFERKQEEKRAEERREERKEELKEERKAEEKREEKKLESEKQATKKPALQKKDGFIKKITSKLKKK